MLLFLSQLCAEPSLTSHLTDYFRSQHYNNFNCIASSLATLTFGVPQDVILSFLFCAYASSILTRTWKLLIICADDVVLGLHVGLIAELDTSVANVSSPVDVTSLVQVPMKADKLNCYQYNFSSPFTS